MKAILDSNLPIETYWKMLELVPEPAGGGTLNNSSLPTAVQRHLQKNERVDSMVKYLDKLDAEAAKVRGDSQLSQAPLGNELLDLIAKQKALMAQVAGKFIKGRLADLAHLIEVLDGDKEIIGFETTKGEKEMLEANFDVRAQLASQPLYRPPMPQTGHEYWPFDGEYWPDEIGYYKYTIKTACAAKKKED